MREKAPRRSLCIKAFKNGRNGVNFSVCLISVIAYFIVATDQQFCSAAPAGGSCTACSTASLVTLTSADAKASGLLSATDTTTPTGTASTNSAGCATLKLTCAAGQVVSIHVIMANAYNDYGNYGSGVLSLECNSQGKWLVPANGEHPGDVVDGYSCVISSTAGG